MGNQLIQGFYKCTSCGRAHNNRFEDLCDKHLKQFHDAQNREAEEAAKRKAEYDRRQYFNELTRAQKDDLLYTLIERAELFY